MYTGKLTQLNTLSRPMRSVDFEGAFHELPTPGKGFQIFGEPLEKGGGLRYICTSTIVEVTHRIGELRGLQLTNVFTFSTQNSTYRLEVFGELAHG
jgi:hypothetical protein